MLRRTIHSESGVSKHEELLILFLSNDESKGRNYLDFPSSLSRGVSFSIPLNAGFTSRESVATRYNAPMISIVACSPIHTTTYPLGSVPSGMPAREPALIVPKTLARISAGNRSCITVRISGLIGEIDSPAMMCQAIRNGNTGRRRNTKSLFIKIHLLLKHF